ncbi:MAG TPA: hypothetical protein PKE06_15705 [Flavilitoribacter sp.]|nr:hypothetical protein [Flavilitoribacter sp.]HMQ87922.1 hypothetical protein [Flavilitoribacter sp.]
MKVLIRLLMCIAVTWAFKCDEPAPDSASAQEASENGPSRRDMRSAYRRAGAVQIVYSTADPDVVPVYLQYADSLRANLRGRLAVSVLADSDLSMEKLRESPLILVGRNFKQGAIDSILNGLPFKLSTGSWEFDGKEYTGPELLFRLNQYPNPLNRQMPVTLISANRDQNLADWIRQQSGNGGGGFFFGGWGYEIFDRNETVAMGEFTDGSWTIDRTSQRDFSRYGDTLSRSAHFVFIDKGAGLTADQLNNLQSGCEAGIARIGAYLGTDRPLPSIRYYLYGAAEDKGLQLRDMDPAQINPDKNEVYVLATPPFNGQTLQPENYLALNAWLGKASKPFLARGLAVFFTGAWHQKGYTYWAGRLNESGNLPALRELLDDEAFSRESGLVMDCSAASFCAYLLDAWGKEKFLEKYRDWSPPDQAETDRLESGWKTWLTRYGAGDQPVFKMKLTALKGFNFAHEGYQVFNGYGSRMAEASLTKLSRLGANTVALVPYGFMRDADRPGFIGVDHGAGGENDESVIQSAWFAHRNGLTTLLKPQIWVSRGWPGDVQMTSEKDWKQFFDFYYRWIRHYALMAEMEHMDALCIGVEFAKATVGHPEAWKQIIRKIRGIYSGPVTYAANWGEEFENLTFWDELDYIGLDCYYPLSDKQSPEKSELQAAFAKVLDKVERISRQYHKPVIFTEIGFRSVATPWRNPHAERGDRPVDQKAQDLCYEVVFEGLRAKPWVAGVLWWKWPSYLDYDGDGGGCFSPNNKLAEATLKKWFGNPE